MGLLPAGGSYGTPGCPAQADLAGGTKQGTAEGKAQTEHTPRSHCTNGAACESPAWDLSPGKAAKTRARGPWYALKQLQLVHTHPAWHIWSGLQASRATWEQATESRSPVWLSRALLTIIPPAPGKDFPFVGNCQDVGRATGHLHHLVAQQGLHDLGLAGEEQQPSAETSQPARLLPSLPPCPVRPPRAQAQRWHHPSFHPTQTPANFFLFFCSKQPSKGFKRLRARSTEDNANISGAEESSQHNGLEREEVQPKGWDSPPCPCGECQGLLTPALSRQGLGAGCVG